MNKAKFRKTAHERYQQDILTPLERRRKVIKMSEEKKNTTPLTPEKIEEVRKLVEGGTTVAEAAAQTGVSVSSVCRIKSGKLTPESRSGSPPPKVRREPAIKPAPAPTFTTLETAADTLSARDVRILRALTEQIIRALAGTEGEQVADDHALGSALGMLTAVQMILGEDDANI